MFISDETVAAVRFNEPHGHLFATEAAYRAVKGGLYTEAVHAVFTENAATKQKTAPEGGLLYSTVATTAGLFSSRPLRRLAFLIRAPWWTLGDLNP